MRVSNNNPNKSQSIDQIENEYVNDGDGSGNWEDPIKPTGLNKRPNTFTIAFRAQPS